MNNATIKSSNNDFFSALLTSMTLSHSFVLNFKLALCLAKKILKDCGSSTRTRVSPKEFPATYSALVTIFLTLHSMTGSKKIQK